MSIFGVEDDHQDFGPELDLVLGRAGFYRQAF